MHGQDGWAGERRGRGTLLLDRSMSSLIFFMPADTRLEVDVTSFWNLSNSLNVQPHHTHEA
jgi:hypothetical protein